MPTVPNWIAKGYAYRSYPRMAYRVIAWRATPTQVVVHVEGLNNELRFGLDHLRRIGAGASNDMRLLPPDDPRVIETVREVAASEVVSELRDALDERLDVSAMGIEELFAAADRIQRAATTAVARLGELL